MESRDLLFFGVCANPDCYQSITRYRPVERHELCDKCADREHDMVGMIKGKDGKE